MPDTCRIPITRPPIGGLALYNWCRRLAEAAARAVHPKSDAYQTMKGSEMWVIDLHGNDWWIHIRTDYVSVTYRYGMTNQEETYAAVERAIREYVKESEA